MSDIEWYHDKINKKKKYNPLINPSLSKNKLKSADEVSEFAENIINTVREPLIVLDKELRVVKASRSFYDFFKVTSDETIGKLIYDLGNHQWNFPKLRELLETILPEKTTFDDYEVEHDFSTIGKRVILLNARQIERAFGKEKIILLAIEDITERKQIEAGLEKTRKELVVIKKSADEVSEFAENIINTVREPLLLLDKELRVVKASRSFFDFFKVNSNETIGTLIYDLGNRQWDIPKLRELLETILPEKTTFDNYEVEHDFSTIGKRIMLLNARQIERAFGKEKIILLAIEDITDRKKSEDEIKKNNEQLIKLNAEKDKFFSIIAHDLKSPFNGFLNLTELMADKTEKFSVAEFAEHSKSLNEAARKLYKLLEHLLEWAQIQKGSINFTPKDSDLSKIVSQSIDSINQRAGQKGITILNEIGNTHKVYADEKMISTVLRNLLSNAVKFTGMDGKVIVKSKPSDNGTIEFTVEDNGVGIPENDVEKLFKIEEKVSTKGTDGESSTGLGLLLCKEFIEMHSGKIWVESEAGKGTKFKFTLSKSILSSA